MNNKENIIFLDFDGVINDNKSDISYESVGVLKSIINKYNAKIVVISSKLQNGRKEIKLDLQNIFQSFELSIWLINPNLKGTFLDIKLPERMIGIVDYIKNHPNCNYVILDDEYHNDYRLLGLNYYKTIIRKGLHI